MFLFACDCDRQTPKRRTSDGFPMGFSDSPMRIDQPTIYEVLHTQPLLQMHAEPILSKLAVPPCCMCGRGLLRLCLCHARMISGAVCCCPIAFCAAHSKTSCDTVIVHNAALLNTVHAMPRFCNSFSALSDVLHAQRQHLSRYPVAWHQLLDPSASPTCNYVPFLSAISSSTQNVGKQGLA